VINNKGWSEEIFINCTQIQGSNVNHEFSGWQEGLDFIMQRQGVLDSAYFVFANDTIFKHRVFTEYRWRLFEAQIQENLPAGFLCRHKSQFRILDTVGDSWMATYLYGLDFNTLKKLNFRLDYGAKLEKLIPTDFTEQIFKYLDPILAKHLSNWLFQGGWYNSQPLSESNYVFFRKKALCILNEKLLTFKIITEGCKVTDVMAENRLQWYLDAIQRKLRYRVLR
jgi:hypothetical protein